jgi:DNA-binding transcriptional regulator YiaG
MISPEQCRAARGWLNISQAELARDACVGLSTVRGFEGGLKKPITNNLAAMQRALEVRGIVFGDDWIAFRSPKDS